MLAAALATWLAVSSAGDRISVAWDTPGEVLQFDTSTKVLVARSAAKPAAIAGLYTLDRFAGTLTVAGPPPRTTAICREPFAGAPTPDGRRLFIACLLPEQASTAERVAARVVVADSIRGSAISSIVLPNGSTGVRGIATSPDGKWAFVTHTLGRFTVHTTQVEQGWINTNALSILNVPEIKLHATVLLDDVDHGAANPWAVAVSPDSKTLYVTHAGTHELSVIEIPAMLRRIAESEDDPVNRLSFLSGIRRRIALPGKGPRALAVSGDSVWVAEYFTRTLARVRMKPALTIDTIAASAGAPETIEFRGEMLFHDASMSTQNWQSCSSCHPDGRADGLNWDLLNDGIGNPKNTRSLVNAHQSGPVMWTAIRESASVAVRAGMRHILFADPSEEAAASIEAWLTSLKPRPGPVRNAAAVERGRKLFHSAQVGCVACHPKPLYTDSQLHDVGTHGDFDFSGGETGRRESQRSFKTPSLLELWRTGPYLHDGRCATVREVITRGNQDGSRGRTAHLTEAELDDLLAFLLSL